MTVKAWIKNREMQGKPTFSYEDVRTAFDNVPDQQLRNELYRLSRQKVVLSVYRGFYTIVPVQYALRETVPPIFYIDQLMAYLKKPYYISLLSAAELYGAAHQRPQKFSVTTLRPVVSTSSRKNGLIVWNYRPSIASDLLCRKNSETGTIMFSSPELTAVDLIQYERQIGGLSMASTVLSELVEKTDFNRRFDSLFAASSATVMQRLGFILENVLEETEQANVLYKNLTATARKLNIIPLSTTLPTAGCDVDRKWKVTINQNIEVDEL